MDSSKKIDMFSGILIFIISVTLFISTFGFQQMTESRVGSAFFPQIASAGMAVMSLLLIVSPLIQKKIKEKTVEGDGRKSDMDGITEREAGEAEAEKVKKKHYGHVIITILLLILCVALLETLGFILSTVMYLFLQMCLMAKKLLSSSFQLVQQYLYTGYSEGSLI